MEKKALTALLKGRTIVSVEDNSCFRADQIAIVLDNGASIQLTYEPPILSFKVIKVTKEEIIDERIYTKVIGGEDDRFK